MNALVKVSTAFALFFVVVAIVAGIAMLVFGIGAVVTIFSS